MGGVVESLTLDREALKALASDTRLDILKRLDERQKTVTELARDLGLNKATVFEHCERLLGADLIQKIEDDRKWVYYQLSWKGRRILHPERMTIALLLSSSLGAVVAAAVAFALFWRTRGPGEAPPPGTEGGVADVAMKESVRSYAQDAAFAAPLQAFLGEPALLGWGLFLVALAVVAASAAWHVRLRGRAAAF